MSPSPIPNDVTVQRPPSPQLAIEICSMAGHPSCPMNWQSRPETRCCLMMPAQNWALSLLGSIEGQSVLELGPLEGGHTYMLHKAGANITSIEANKRGFPEMPCCQGTARAKSGSVPSRSLRPVVGGRAAPLRFGMGDRRSLPHERAARVITSNRELHRLRPHLDARPFPMIFDPKEAWAYPTLHVEEREFAGRRVLALLTFLFRLGRICRNIAAAFTLPRFGFVGPIYLPNLPASGSSRH